MERHRLDQQRSMRRILADHFGREIVFTAEIGVRGYTKDKKHKTICLVKPTYKGEIIDDHIWIIGECNIPKGMRVCVAGKVKVYDNYTNYGLYECVFIRAG